MTIEIDQDKCLQDGICVAECPSRLLKMNTSEDYPSSTPDVETFCLQCGHCVAVCPTGALSLDELKPDACAPMAQDLRVTPEQAEQFLTGRRSIRTFKQKTVPSMLIDLCSRISACRTVTKPMVRSWSAIPNSNTDAFRFATHRV